MFVAGLPSNLKEQYKEMHTEDFLYLACYLHHYLNSSHCFQPG